MEPWLEKIIKSPAHQQKIAAETEAAEKRRREWKASAEYKLWLQKPHRFVDGIVYKDEFYPPNHRRR